MFGIKVEFFELGYQVFCVWHEGLVIELGYQVSRVWHKGLVMVFLTGLVLDDGLMVLDSSELLLFLRQVVV